MTLQRSRRCPALGVLLKQSWLFGQKESALLPLEAPVHALRARASTCQAHRPGRLASSQPALASRARRRASHKPSSRVAPHNVSPNQGKLLTVLAQAVCAPAILEIGTLGGYSTIWLARAVAPGGRVITLEANPMHAKIARANVAHAGLADRVDMRLESPRLTADACLRRAV